MAVVPLSAFAEDDPPRHLIRLCFAKRDETIDAGVAAMARAKEFARHDPGGRSAPAPCDELGVVASGGSLVSLSPIDGQPIGSVACGDAR